MALRAAPVAFAAAVNATLPLPVPLAPLVTDSHAALDAAVHAQPLPAVTATDPVPPPTTTVWLDGAIVYEHAGGGGAAAV